MEPAELKRLSLMIAFAVTLAKHKKTLLEPPEAGPAPEPPSDLKKPG